MPNSLTDKTLFSACFCNSVALDGFLPTGENCGCSSTAEQLCFKNQSCCLSDATKGFHTSAKDDGSLTLGLSTEGENTICLLGLHCCECGLVSPKTCMKSQSQNCCIIQSCAFPCDDDVPMALAGCGLACLPGFGCCKTYGELQGA